jgi:hypothetical protein
MSSEDFHQPEAMARLAVILSRAFGGARPRGSRGTPACDRQRRGGDGHHRAGSRDPESGALIFMWADKILVGIAPELLAPGAQPPASSN